MHACMQARTHVRAHTHTHHSVQLAPSIGGKRSQLIHDALAHLLRPPPAARPAPDGGPPAPARPSARRQAAGKPGAGGGGSGAALSPAAWARLAALVRRCAEAELLAAVPSDARALVSQRRRAG